MLRNLAAKKPTPNYQEFIDVVLGKKKPHRVPLVEYSVADSVMRPIITDILHREWVPNDDDPASRKGYLDNYIAFWHGMGYDYVRRERGIPFKIGRIETADTAPGAEENRRWADEHVGAIQNWEDFEQYPWPQARDVDLADLEYLATHLPEGMGLITCHSGGIFEFLSSILSLEGLCIALCEDPALVQAVADKVGNLLVDYYKRLIQLDNLVVLFQGDDMGFRTQTLVPPDALRQYCLPWHKKFAAIAHEQGIPYFLHSCGQVDAIMEDLITDVQIDAKHSFEDVIVPPEAFHAQYGDRIGVLGGLDLNRLVQDTPDDVRRHTRFLMETCGTKGRYAIGSGNSVPNYVPVENYLAMIDEVAGFTF